MNPEHETYIHLTSCVENFNNAWRLLKEIKSTKQISFIINAAFQFALIEYSKPYKNSIGNSVNNKGKKIQYKLLTEFIPDEHKDLHKRIINNRDQFYAHNDLTIKDAKLIVSKVLHMKNIGILQNYINGSEELKNIDLIIDLIEKTLETIYIKLKTLEQHLNSEKE